jgi:hemerythrin-like metal-binding protein
MIAAQRMFDILNNTPHPRVGKVTASFGVAERHKSEDFNQWYKRTDDAMYIAKEHGRNTIVSAGETMKSSTEPIYLEWNNEWNCGDLTIDGQHRELLEIGNKLVFLTVSGAAPQQISEQIDRLLMFVANHFSSEELIIEKLNYPDFEEHQRIHQELLIRTSEISSEYLHEEGQSPISMAFIINDLIMGHLINEDRKFFSYIPKSAD